MFNWNKMGGSASVAGIVEEDYSIENNGHLVALEEAYQDLAEINESFADLNAQAVDAYADGGQVAMEAFAGSPVMEGFFGDLKDKIVNSLKKLWAKIKAFFKSAMSYFNAIFMSGKEFANKYKDAIQDNDLSGFKYEMFNYTLDKVDTTKVFTSVLEEVDNLSTEEIKPAGRKKAMQAVMASLCGEQPRDEAAFRKAISKKLRDGKTEKHSVSPNINNVISVLTDNEDLEKCKDTQADFDDAFQKEIDRVEDIRDRMEAKKDDKDSLIGKDAITEVAEYWRNRYSAFLASKSIAVTVFDLYKSAVKEREGAYKGCLSAALHFSAKK